MANTLTYSIKANVGDDNGNTIIKKVADYTRASVDEANMQRFTLADGVTDQQIAADNVDGFSMLMIIADQAVTVKVGGTEADRAIACATTLTEGSSTHSMFMCTASGTNLAYLSNASGSDATVEIIML